MSKRKITKIKELLIEFEKYGTAKEVIEELSEKYLNEWFYFLLIDFSLDSDISLPIKS